MVDVKGGSRCGTSDGGFGLLRGGGDGSNGIESPFATPIKEKKVSSLPKGLGKKDRD